MTEGDDASPKRRNYTISMAVPGSIIDNTQNLEFATFVAGQVARTAAIFNVDEFIVFDDSPTSDRSTISSGSAFLARVAQFMETPQYLRKALIPMHQDLRLAGLLPPLDAPHHMRATEWKMYREGVILKSEKGTGSFVDIGLDRTAYIKTVVPVGTRVTLYVGEQQKVEFMEQFGESMIIGEVVPTAAPREKHGLYWGYTTRLAHGVSGIFSECPFKGGYDLKLGTSEHGVQTSQSELRFPKFKHMLIAFGGLQGLEDCIRNDNQFKDRMPEQVFDMYINTCPEQGSRTIRTEEAVLVSLSYIQPGVAKAQQGRK